MRIVTEVVNVYILNEGKVVFHGTSTYQLTGFRRLVSAVKESRSR